LQIPYPDFVNKELILFSLADCLRCIPSVMDGFKPGQRKILFACLKRNLRNESKVAQISGFFFFFFFFEVLFFFFFLGYISEVSSYHHGEVSLQSSITNMARDFVGSNNINLLLPIGQFGTRREGFYFIYPFIFFFKFFRW
jgi:DNA topoisomerase-2